MCGAGWQDAKAQIAPSTLELARYEGLFKAAADGDLASISALLSSGANVAARDAAGRTAYLIAAFQQQRQAMRLLAQAGADTNALERQAYDAVTIAAVADDVETLKIALETGNSASNITSPYNGTALIAAAHLGHDEVVKILIEAGAPLDHINSLGWTALIEAVMLGDGGERHVNVAKALVAAGADGRIADGGGFTPLELAKQRGFSEMMKVLEN